MISREEPISYVAKKPIEVKVTYTPGYEQRFTQACIEVAKRRESRKEVSA